MIRALERILKTENLLTEDDRLVVGVSGGADSVALLHLLLDLNRHRGWRLHLHIAHLNHQLRGRDSDADENFVKELAAQLSLPCTVDRRDVSALAAQSSQTVEEAGRKERYTFFERVCLQTGCNTVAVAHHADDQAETILHRIIRGTGLRGLAGIPRDRPLQRGSSVRLIRPVLHISRDELRQYLKQRDTAFRHDRSNESAEPTRNWIRIHLLPLIRSELNPRVDAALIRLACQAADLRSSTDDLVARTLETIVITQTESRLSLNAESLSHKSRFLQTAIIVAVCRSMGVREKKMSASHLIDIVSLINDPNLGSPVSLPGGWRFHRAGRELILELTPHGYLVAPRPTPVPLTIPGTTCIPSLNLSLTAEWVDPSIVNSHPRDESRDSSHIQEVDFDTLRPPLIIRTRLPGDRFHPLGAPGPKSLSDFLIDQKIARRARDHIPILCDQSGVVWVVRHRIADRVRLTAETRRVLRFKLRAGET